MQAQAVTQKGQVFLSSENMLIQWDDNDKREIEEAKSYYRLARTQNRKIVDVDGNQITAFRSFLQAFRILEPELNDTQMFMRILNDKGDESVIWDSKDPKETEEAAERFNIYMGKGWRAYAISQDGLLKRRIKTFNPRAEEVVFIEGSGEAVKEIKDSLAGFVKKFKTVWMTPRTYPG